MGGKKTYELLLEIGHKSQPLKTKLANGYTHKWSVFVRGANNSKIENCIQRVVFQLHESFDNPYREISDPPFQVKETGYAGFEIPIEIYFKHRDKPNHVVIVLDLCLLTNKPNSSIRVERVKFTCPSRDFEKCLIKSGAQLLQVTKDKKERSDSPPAKKQKSSSLIPSKDMSKLAVQQNQSHSQSYNHSHSSSQNHLSSSQSQHHHQSKPSQHSHSHHGYTNHTNNSSNSNNQTAVSNSNNQFSNSHVFHYNNGHHSNHNNQYQTSAKALNQHVSSLPKSKSSSREFMDVFGAPLVYNNNKGQKSSNVRDNTDNHRDLTFATTERSPLPPILHQPSPQLSVSQSLNNHSHHKSHHNSHHHNHHHHKHSHNHSKPQADAPKPAPQPPTQQKTPQKQPQLQLQQQSQAFVVQADPLLIIQNKISALTDCDRLQKIVDIIEESGEWFNLTPNKFEFDLKRLDKKTLSRIEKCLPS